MTKHARLSPSSSERWLSCLASPIMESGKPNTSSRHSAEGTLAHHLAETALITGQRVESYQGVKATVDNYGNVNVHKPHREEHFEGYEFDVDRTMTDYIAEYTGLVQSVKESTNGELFVEQRVELEKITGERGAKGTADAVIVTNDEIVVIDLKFGQGVQVEAEENSQLMMYGLGALNKYDILGDIKNVRLIICQPRRHHTSEWSIDAEALRQWGREVRKKADKIHTLTDESDLQGLFAPSEKACRWCKASSECKPYAEYVHNTVMADFISLQSPLVARDARMNNELLAIMYERVDLIRNWCKTIEAVTFEKLNLGEPVGDFKLVQGRSGARKWLQEDQAEEALKAIGLKNDALFKRKLISPTDAEKLAKAGDITKNDWQVLQDLVVKPEGKPTIAPYHDKREALNPVDCFEDLTK